MTSRGTALDNGVKPIFWEEGFFKRIIWLVSRRLTSFEKGPRLTTTIKCFIKC